MQRMFNLDKWLLLKEGETITFPSRRPRTVKVEVNAPQSVCLYVRDGDKPNQFLALVEGRDTVEFSSAGDFSLSVEEGSIWVYSADGDHVHAVVEDPVIFTRIAERRTRNPELEYITHVMQSNLERRLAQQADELERAIVARERAREAQRVKAATPETTVSAGEPPAGDGKPSKSPSKGTGDAGKAAAAGSGNADGAGDE